MEATDRARGGPGQALPSACGSARTAPAADRARGALAGKLLGAARGARLRQLPRAARGRGRAALHGPAAAREAAAAPRRARRPLNIKQCALMFSSNTIMYILIIINKDIIDIQMYNLHYFCTLLFINVNINKQKNVHYCNQ